MTPPARFIERILWWVADKAERAAFRMREARDVGTEIDQNEWPFWKYLAYVKGPVVTSKGRPKRARPMRRKG